MKKVIEIRTHTKPWGSTSRQVASEVENEIAALNTPAPFETTLDKPDIKALASRMQNICDDATRQRRKGMMISSRFRVHYDTTGVSIWHVRNEKEERRFISLLLIS